MSSPRLVEAILLDIEGTTTPISFVYEVLFPYAEARLDLYCQKAAGVPALDDAIDELRREYTAEMEIRGDALPEFGDGAPYARLLMEEDRKSTGLKLLQGLIWEEGYRTGELKSEVFPDVPPALERWKEADIRLRVYSSGSVLAQKLLFAHTQYGDLVPFFEGFHDTHTGPKKEVSSYSAIAGAFGLAPERVLFLSDNLDELNAARWAGMPTGFLARPGNSIPPAHTHDVFPDFSGIPKAV